MYALPGVRIYVYMYISIHEVEDVLNACKECADVLNIYVQTV